jgi:hypothetical protein
MCPEFTIESRGQENVFTPEDLLLP